jgi:excisionase family DNA binding protein
MMAKKKPALSLALSAPPDELLTLQEAQAALRCSKPTIYQLGRQGRLRLVKFGRGTRITGTSLRQLISEIASGPAIVRKG